MDSIIAVMPEIIVEWPRWPEGEDRLRLRQIFTDIQLRYVKMNPTVAWTDAEVGELMKTAGDWLLISAHYVYKKDRNSAAVWAKLAGVIFSGRAGRRGMEQLYGFASDAEFFSVTQLPRLDLYPDREMAEAAEKLLQRGVTDYSAIYRPIMGSSEQVKLQVASVKASLGQFWWLVAREVGRDLGAAPKGVIES